MLVVVRSQQYRSYGVVSVFSGTQSEKLAATDGTARYTRGNVGIPVFVLGCPVEEEVRIPQRKEQVPAIF